MTDAKLFELAVSLVVAKLNNCTIPPGVIGQDDMIMDNVREMHSRLREEWREVHHEDNVHDFPSTDR